MSEAAADSQFLTLRGVRENNLKELTLNIRHDSFTVITGVSGSGKSTLAFDTIYAEGGRRYIETFSPYTRQFLDRLHRPDLDSISGVRPALALEQRNRTTSSRSTVGTVTEINDYLKVIWSYLGALECSGCGQEITKDSPAKVCDSIMQDEKMISSEHLLVCFPLPLSGAASIESLAETLQAEGFLRFFSSETNSPKKIEELPSELESSTNQKEILIVVDRVSVKRSSTATEKATKDRLLSSVGQAYSFGHGKTVIIGTTCKGPQPRRIFVQGLRCADCNISYRDPKPSLFSFNSPLGACPECHGFGKTLEIDPSLIVPDPRKSINEGAIACWNTDATAPKLRRLKEFCEEQEIDLDTAWKKLSASEKQLVLEGESASRGYKGVFGWFARLQRKRHRMHVRVLLSRYRSEVLCASCEGTRLIPDAMLYRVSGYALPQIWGQPLEDVLIFFETLLPQHLGDPVLETALEEILSRVRYLVDIGLGYLTLDRQSRTLSGGESQRVNLTSILGARLVNTMLVLDEPTIGLHTRDTNRLLHSLTSLKERGNTVLVVEHDPEVIRTADEVIDLGPQAGGRGGEIVYQGPVSGLSKAKESYTGQYFAGKLEAAPRQRKSKSTQSKSISIIGAKAHNLKDVSVDIPLGQIVMLTGVSGSGKSTLVTSCLHEPYRRLRQGLTIGNIRSGPDAPIENLKGLNAIDDIVLIDQQPIGKSPRSNPATYTKAWDTIRECLAETDAAEQLGLSKSAFSFNVDGGRCPACSGAGQVKIEMQFLADVYVECEACGGTRFQDKVLGVRFAGKNVIDLLSMSLTEAEALFSEHAEPKRAAKISAALKPMLQLGLGYLRLGHPLNTVSGGEAQRIKLASYMSERNKDRCLFILDEPTTGLHPFNINDLLASFEHLIDRGHSILCVEHNLDVIAFADWIIDLGPEGGVAGGEIVAEGTPQSFQKKTTANRSSYTAQLLVEYADNKTKSTTGRNGAGSSKKKKAPASLSAARSKARETQNIEVLHARQHNLKDISVQIPHNQLSVITGVSGSGKSTLAFDIVFAEGQRRYIDCLSPYARQYIKQLSRADVDRIHFIPPTIAVSQKTAPPMGITTIATITEIYQYLRLLYSKLGTQHCVVDDTPISSLSVDSITQRIAQQFKGKRIRLFAPVVSGRKGFYNDLFIRALKAEITEAKVDGSMITLEPELRLERHKLHWISLAVASIGKTKANDPLLKEAVEQCLVLGGGTVEVYEDVYENPFLFSTERVCLDCGRGYRELDPQDFSFRSARGVCATCGGRGRVETKGRDTELCPECEGARIAEIGRHVYIDGKRIDELTAMSAPELLTFLTDLTFDKRFAPVLDPILHELTSRLSVIVSVGLEYLHLNRDASSISGGEAQRLRLARTMGSPLTGVCYVLDEPSIGLHPQDQEQLMGTLHGLRDAGNTVIVVEHDEDTIRQADHVIDVGPGGGSRGGEIVVCGSPADVEASSRSLTGEALRERSKRNKNAYRKALGDNSLPGDDKYMILEGARTNNLQNLTARFPLQRLTVVVGVSGAGKSSLVHGTLVPAIVEEFEGEAERAKFYDRSWDSLSQTDNLERLIEIDQTPVGKTSTSTPASYLGIFNDIRKMYALLTDAKAKGWTASHFSFNTGKGRCDICEGKGFIKVPMSFLPDARTSCDSCGGMRYNDETLELLYQGISIGELLGKTFREARGILSNHRKICRSLDYVLELGLGYLTLGQPTHTLSGGEAQRLKIARELGLREAKNTLYILDEPTTGLHMVDVEKLRSVLQKLIDMGNTVVVIEHNLDIIRSADYLLELGPGPGEKGGTLLFAGTPRELASQRRGTPTKPHLLGAVISEKTTTRAHQQ